MNTAHADRRAAVVQRSAGNAPRWLLHNGEGTRHCLGVRPTRVACLVETITLPVDALRRGGAKACQLRSRTTSTASTQPRNAFARR